MARVGYFSVDPGLNLRAAVALGAFSTLHVVPQIRWGNEYSCTTKYFPERIAFLGAERRSIVAVGTYGCIGGKDNRYHFEAGLEAMMETLKPVVVLVYGSMPDGFAQNLANKLNATVYAPTDIVWAYPDGRHFVAPRDPKNPGSPHPTARGIFMTFHSGGNKK